MIVEHPRANFVFRTKKTHARCPTQKMFSGGDMQTARAWPDVNWAAVSVLHLSWSSFGLAGFSGFSSLRTFGQLLEGEGVSLGSLRGGTSRCIAWHGQGPLGPR